MQRPVSMGARAAKETRAMQRDPVCGTELDPAQALHTEYQGKPYSFCSLRCKQAFEDHPRSYAAQEPRPNRSAAAAEKVAQTLTMAQVTDTINR